jgi:hypothetical protein
MVVAVEERLMLAELELLLIKAVMVVMEEQQILMDHL